ncbi:MAG TPA: hypothetical protein VIA82_01785 [Candidatus Limnocylindria bacterium]
MTEDDSERTHAVTIADVAPIEIQARRYLLEPGDAAWNDVVRALDGALGETEADDLLKAVEIRLRTAKRL